MGGTGPHTPPCKRKVDLPHPVVKPHILLFKVQLRWTHLVENLMAAISRVLPLMSKVGTSAVAIAHTPFVVHTNTLYIMDTQATTTPQEVTQAEPQVTPQAQAEPQADKYIMKITPRQPYKRGIYFSTSEIKGFKKVDTFSKSLSCLSNVLLQQNDEVLPLIGAELQARPHLQAANVYAKLAPIFNGAIVEVNPILLQVGDTHPETERPVDEETTYLQLIRCKLAKLPQVWIERALKFIEALPTEPAPTNASTSTNEPTDPFA